MLTVSALQSQLSVSSPWQMPSKTTVWPSSSWPTGFHCQSGDLRRISCKHPCQSASCGQDDWTCGLSLHHWRDQVQTHWTHWRCCIVLVPSSVVWLFVPGDELWPESQWCCWCAVRLLETTVSRSVSAAMRASSGPVRQNFSSVFGFDVIPEIPPWPLID